MAALNGSEFSQLNTESELLAGPSNARDDDELLWAAIERLPSVKRRNAAALRRTATELGRSESEGGTIETLDVRKLDRTQRELLVEKALATSEQDNFRLLSGIKQRLNRVGLELPKVEVRFSQLNISARVQTGSRALPTLLNYTIDTFEGLLTSLNLYQTQKQSLTILNNVDGYLKPGRMTLLLGPPGAGKSSLLLALSGKLDPSLKQVGDVTYNGHTLDEFCVKRTSAYIGQTDNHIAELTVRETLDFAARCQGASEAFPAGYSRELARLEKEQNIRPSPEIDAFMKASSVKGKKRHILTDYILRVLGLNVCSETIVGDDMLRGVSGGQRKRVTTGEMIVGPRKTLLMDEISTGLDSSTTFQIVKCIGNFVHQMEGTVLVALLQPAPETFELFDDLILLSEGYMVYHGPRADVLEFFESLGFKLPPRKGVADFLQEVTSKKDQAQYWADHAKPYRFITVPEIAEAFKKSSFGIALQHELSTPFDKSKNYPTALAKSRFAVPKWELFIGCLQRELILLSRHRFLYIFRTCQVAFVGLVAATTFIRSKIHPRDEENGQLYMACLFYSLVHMLFNGISELSLTMHRLPVFYKQRDNYFYPAWAWSCTSWLLRVPYSIVESVVWSCVVYYSVGLAPSPLRFFRYMLILFLQHQMAVGLFRMLAVIARDITIANTVSSCALLLIFSLGGYIVPKNMIKKWWIWGYWASPLSYAQKALAVNEFTASRWNEKSAIANSTVGVNILNQQSMVVDKYWYWYGAGALFLYGLLFNIIGTVALTYLNPVKASAVVAVTDELESNPKDGAGADGGNVNHLVDMAKGMILPFQPLTMTFHNVNYFVDMPKAMKAQGVTESRLQLLSNVSGAFSPGVLTALVGSSGAGKTTLLDVLAGRKTSGYIEGDIRVSGYPKVQSTFARVAAYVEQNDIHSPQVTVEESLWFSSVLRLPNDLPKETKREFVEQVMELVELQPLRHAIVGLPGISGLSTEQRKRLTIGVELVANPSIIFMDEPTSGLDARAAAIVMRTVRNTVDTGRTVVCTIHQPSIDIFEAFDELVLMKRGGRIIYGGKLGVHSQIMIDYFQAINGIPPIPAGYNPATWMLEVTTPSMEEKIGQDFGDLYKKSNQFKDVEAGIEILSQPEAGTQDLHFDKPFPQDSFSQFKICLEKQFLVYWRSPQYNVVRILLTTIVALILGTVYWKAGAKRDNVEHLFSLMGALYAACLFLGVSNATSVQPIVSTERKVFYREKAAGMYSPLAYAAAQGIVEIPYVLAQTVIYSLITYFMMDFDNNLRKFFFYFIFMFMTFTYFTFYGMMAVGLTPSQHHAAITSSASYSLWNLFSGFLVPLKHIPGWWIWVYYICPVGWTLRGVITSQLSNVDSIVTAPHFNGTVSQYIEHQFGYKADWVGYTVLVLLAFNALFFGSFMASLKLLNYQKR